MMFAHSDMAFIADTSPYGVQTMVIENQRCLREIISDIAAQIDGQQGKAVLSENDVPLDMARHAELLQDLLTFDLNRKSLLTKIAAALEKEALVSEYAMEIAELLAGLERLIDKLAFAFPCDICCTKLNFSSLLKAVGLAVRDEYGSQLEKLVDYMELVREFDRDKLFFTVNLRSFFTDEECGLFMETVAGHGFHVIMLESMDRPKLKLERRITIDTDLCEF